MGKVAKQIKIPLQHGFTALELIIVLVVGFSIIALSASKMGQLFSSSSTASAMTSILDIYAATRSLRGHAGYGSDKLTKALVTTGMMPKGLIITGDTIQNEWGGDIEVEGKDTGFEIAYPKVPGDACGKIAQNLLKSGNFSVIQVEGEDFTYQSSVAEVVEACGSGNSGVGVTMTFVYSEIPLSSP